MKRYKNIVFICLLCVCMAGCGKQTSDTGIVSEDSEVFAENSIVETKEEFTGETLGTEEENTTLEDLEMVELPSVSNPDGIAYEELPDEIKGMFIPVDSLLLYYVGVDGAYNPNDPDMFWFTMHYSIGNFGEANNRATLEGSEWAVSGKDILEFAASFDAEFEKIPAIPDWLNPIIRYDIDTDTYFFGVGDRGLSKTEILSYEYLDKDTVKVKARLFGMEDDETICEGDFTLVRNENADTVAEPLFYFSVSNAEFTVK